MTQPGGSPRRVAVTGSSGLIGAAVSTALRDRGDQVVHLVRRAPRADLPDGVTEVEWQPAEGRLDSSALTGVDAVVNLGGAGLGDHRWTEDYKRTLRASRVDSTALLSGAVAALSPVPRLVSGSAVGIYGERGDDVLTEESQPSSGFLSGLVRDWETATWRAEEAGSPVAHIRTGIVLSREGGAMGRVLPLAKFGLAGRLGSGTQYWSWITLHDTARAILFLVDHPEIIGAVNLTGPHPDTQQEVIEVLGDQLRRPTKLKAPTIALRLALGEMASEVLASARALPTVLQDAGFEYDHPDLDSAIRYLLDHDAA